VNPEAARALTWGICAAAATGVVVRPFRTAEAAWALAGAVLLVALGLVSPSQAAGAVGKGRDVYLFLAGMMVLAQVARREGLFEAVAALAVRGARGSPRRLLVLVYAAGAVVTTFLSNDATAVVMTPAVFAAARRAKTDPLPHLFACALVANAASFVLPISNPANLVLFAGSPPPLGRWLESFATPSLAAILATFAALRWAERSGLAGDCERRVERARLGRGGQVALAGLGATAAVLLAASALGWPLGLPTAAMAAATLIAVTAVERASPLPVLAAVDWPVLALVAGLFVLVGGLERTGFIALVADALARAQAAHPTMAAWGAGAGLALAGNLVNNLPAGLAASAAAAQAHAARPVLDALLIGVDVGPNLSVTGSLATILWLAAIRREGAHVGFWRFLSTGLKVAPPALALALAARLLGS
jgi:arsenical pump membrane protein